MVISNQIQEFRIDQVIYTQIKHFSLLNTPKECQSGEITTIKVPKTKINT